MAILPRHARTRTHPGVLTPARLFRARLSRIVHPAFPLVLSLLAAGACSAGDSASERPESPRAESAPQPVGSTAPGVQRRARTVVGVFTDLRADPLLEGARVKVSGSGTTLVLAGEVSSPAVRDRALEIARRHLGTFTLLDSLRIAAPAPDRAAEPTNEGAS